MRNALRQTLTELFALACFISRNKRDLSMKNKILDKFVRLSFYVIFLHNLEDAAFLRSQQVFDLLTNTFYTVNNSSIVKEDVAEKYKTYLLLDKSNCESM